MGVDDLTAPIDLTPFEAEHFVQCIHELDFETIGDKKFLDLHEKVEKLQTLAHYQAEDKTDEYVVDLINTHDKLKILIANLMTVELWSDRIFHGRGLEGTNLQGESMKTHVCGMSSIRSYVPPYHEASTVSLIEMCLFQSSSCETGGDALVDLVDYVYRKLSYMVQTPNKDLYSWPPKTTEEAMAKTDTDVLHEQILDMEFQVG